MKVFIAERSPLIRERLDSLLSEIPDIEIVGHSGEVEEAYALIQTSCPDVVIIDSSLPAGGGIGLLRRLRDDKSPCIAVVIASSPTSLYRAKLHAAGAVYLFDKSREQDRLIEALIAIKKELA